MTNSRLQSGNIPPSTPVNKAILTINQSVKGLDVSCSGGEISDSQGVSQGTIPATAGNQYTISAKVINSGKVTIDRFTLQFQFYDSLGTSQFLTKEFSIPSNGKVNNLSFTSTAPANTTEMRIYYLDIATSANVPHTFTIYDMKLEQGSTVTPWMPSFSEASAEDYPSYIGTYTDNKSNEQSTDPEKYSWKKID